MNFRTIVSPNAPLNLPVADLTADRIALRMTSAPIFRRFLALSALFHAYMLLRLATGRMPLAAVLTLAMMNVLPALPSFRPAVFLDRATHEVRVRTHYSTTRIDASGPIEVERVRVAPTRLALRTLDATVFWVDGKRVEVSLYLSDEQLALLGDVRFRSDQSSSGEAGRPPVRHPGAR